MTVRSIIQELLATLAAEKDDCVQEAVVAAALVLEQSNQYRGYEHAGGQVASSPNLREEHAARRQRDIETEYKLYRDQGLLGANYVGLRLTDEEHDAITHALIPLLCRAPQIASAAAAALAQSASLRAAVELAAEARRRAPADVEFTWNAVRALGSILAGRAINPRAALRESTRRVIADVVELLQGIAASGAFEPLNTRACARQELARIERRFGRRL